MITQLVQITGTLPLPALSDIRQLTSRLQRAVLVGRECVDECLGVDGDSRLSLCSSKGA